MMTVRSTLLFLPLTIPEVPHFLIRLLPDSYLMKEKLTPDKVSNPQKVFGNPSQYLG